MLDYEWQAKQKHFVEFLNRHQLEGVLLHDRNNFAWATGGKDNHIANNTHVGVAAILATRDSRVCLANSIEAPRMREEELAGTGIEVFDFPWYDRDEARRKVKYVLAARKVAADTDLFGLLMPSLPRDWAEVRWSLTDDEVQRYRDGAARTSAAIEAACRDIKHRMTEHDAAGLLSYHVHIRGLNPVVTLVAADERVEKFRHPIPTMKKIERYAMLVICAEHAGLISNCTRLIHFGPLPADLRMKQQAVCNVDTAVNLSTVPEKNLGEIFAILQKAYADNGFGDQWKLHHQGGSTGYANREVTATPASSETVVENQAFAWNPSITGVKSEDTVLATSSGIEVLTKCSTGWPMVVGHFEGRELFRPDILVK